MLEYGPSDEEPVTEDGTMAMGRQPEPQQGDFWIATEPDDADARRLLKRLRRTGEHIFTFLDYPEIPFENNFAERQIRPAVLLRKNSQSNRSDRGATRQAMLMSIYRTLRLRGHDPLQTIANALRTDLPSGQLPPLPVASTAYG